MKLFKNNDNPINNIKNINELASLGIDMLSCSKYGNRNNILQYANTVYALIANHLMYVNDNITFANRDRIITSNLGIDNLFYGAYFLGGCSLELDNLKDFKYLEDNYSNLFTSLKDSISYAVGASIGEKHANSLIPEINYNVYALVNENSLNSGISIESLKLAVNLNLNNLIILSVCNSVNKDVYEALGLNIITTENNYEEINKAILDAKKSNIPSIIYIKPLSFNFDINSDSEIKENLSTRNIPFTISNDVMEDFQYLINERLKDFSSCFDNMSDSEEIVNLFKSLTLNNKRISSNNVIFIPEEGESTLSSSSKLLNGYYENSKIIFGASTNYSEYGHKIKNFELFSSSNYLGSNLDLSNNLMSAPYIVNGICNAGFRPFLASSLLLASSFLPAIITARNLNLPVIYLFKGNTFETLNVSYLRDISDIDIFRPCDANEVLGTYKAVMSKEEGTSAILLSTHDSTILDSTSINDTIHGGYVAYPEKINLDAILISSGEDVYYAIEISKILFTKGIDVRVVSMPNLKRFLNSSSEYKDNVLPVEKRKIILENSNSSYWNKVIFNSKYILNYKNFELCKIDNRVDTEKLALMIEDLLK